MMTHCIRASLFLFHSPWRAVAAVAPEPPAPSGHSSARPQELSPTPAPAPPGFPAPKDERFINTSVPAQSKTWLFFKT